MTEIKNNVTSNNNSLNTGCDATVDSSNSIEHFKWTATKPDFTEECVLITAQYYGKKHRDYENRQYEYTLWEIKKLDGELEDGSYGWYWGLLCSDGEEWGPLEDLAADLYMTMPLMPNIEQEDNRSVATMPNSKVNPD